MRVILLGPPGAGKGTHGIRLAADLGVPHIATGDMFRHESSLGTPMGQRLRSYIDRGELVPDEVTNELVESRLEEPDAFGGFVLDGYPRNIGQAGILEGFLAGKGENVDRAIAFTVAAPEIVARLSGRRVCPADGSVYHIVTNPPKVPGICDVDGTPLIQREDDNEDTIMHRLDVYGQSTKPLYNFYSERGILDEVDAIGPVDAVYDRLRFALGIGPTGPVDLGPVGPSGLAGSGGTLNGKPSSNHRDQA